MLKKELRALLPLVLLLFVVSSGMDLLFEPLTGRLDERAWHSGYGSDLLPGEGGGHAVGFLILGLIAAYSAFPREHDDKTIEFLYSLPISRPQIFFSKVLAGAIVLVGAVGAESLTTWLLQLPNPQSFTGEEWRWGLALPIAFLHASYVLLVYCHGVLLSFVRKFGLIAVVMVAWATLFLGDRFPELVFLDPTRLIAFAYQGADLVLPWGDLALHAGLALASLGLAYVLWMGPAQRFSQLYLESQTGSRDKVACGCCGTLLVVFALLAFLVYLTARSADGEPKPDAQYVSFETVDAETEHYLFRYPANLRGRALRLVAKADDAYVAVRGLLNAKVSSRIVVDLTEVSADHAGITAWQKIRMSLVGHGDDDAYTLRVFHHETAHAFQLQESDRRMSESGNATRFFAEGSAEWVAFELVPAEDERRASRQIATAAWRRQRIRFEDLIDSASFSVRRDTNMVYALGETWTEALTEAHGRDALGRVLRAMGREGAPRDLSPAAFWQDTLQAAGCNLELVIGAWESLMARLAEEEAAFLRDLPAMGGGVAEADEETIVLVATLDRPALPDAKYRVRVRDNAGVRDTEITTYPGEASGPRQVRFEVPREVLTGRTFEFQFGLQVSEDVWPYYEPWQSAPLPRG